MAAWFDKLSLVGKDLSQIYLLFSTPEDRQLALDIISIEHNVVEVSMCEGKYDDGTEFYSLYVVRDNNGEKRGY